MDELYELTVMVEEARRREMEAKAEWDEVLRRNVLLEDENHRLRQLLECFGVPVKKREF